MDNIGVWLKDDLRLEDNPAFISALTSCTAQKSQKLPIVLLSDESKIGHVRHTDNRKSKDHNARQYIISIVKGAGAEIVEIDSRKINQAVYNFGITELHANIQVGDNISYLRDREVRAFTKAQGIAFIEHSTDSLRRTGLSSNVSRNSEKLFITSARDLVPFKFPGIPDAMEHLRSYLRRLPSANYRRDMWTPGPDAKASSRLSIALANGTLSSERVLYEAQKEADAATSYQKRHYKDFCARVIWRNSFIQMLENNVGAFPWNAMREERQDDCLRMQAWLSGETGYPLVDAAMRDLTANGWINFRLRQVLLSFAVDLLDLDFHKVGVVLGGLFDDYCPGIHWCQIALQSGMIKDRGPRVINPIKQMAELDPEASYCKKWLPWLENLPAAYLHEPWKYQEYTGPMPIVHYASAAQEARKRRV